MGVDAGVETGNGAVEHALFETRRGATDGALREKVLVRADVFFEAVLLIDGIPNAMSRGAGITRESLGVLQQIHILETRILVLKEEVGEEEGGKEGKRRIKRTSIRRGGEMAVRVEGNEGKNREEGKLHRTGEH